MAQIRSYRVVSQVPVVVEDVGIAISYAPGQVFRASDTNPSIVRLLEDQKIALASTADPTTGYTIVVGPTGPTGPEGPTGAGASQTLAETLALGNTTGTNNIVISTGRSLVGQTALSLAATGANAVSFTSHGSTIALNTSGDPTLDTTAQDIIGAINEVLGAVTAADTLSEVLANGNTTGGNDIVVSTGDEIVGAAELHLSATGANAISFSTSGAPRWSIDANGHFIAGVDDAYDIGATGATRPRRVYVGTEVAIGNTMTIDVDSVATTDVLSISSGDGWNLNLNSGYGLNLTTKTWSDFEAGGISIYGGNITNGTNVNNVYPAWIDIQAGSTTGGEGHGGWIQIGAGNARNGGDGGFFQMWAGSAGFFSSDGDGGFFQINAGDGGSAGGSGGYLGLFAGDANGGTDNGGDVMIDAGSSAGGTAGSIDIGVTKASAVNIGAGATGQVNIGGGGNEAGYSITIRPVNGSGNSTYITGAVADADSDGGNVDIYGGKGFAGRPAGYALLEGGEADGVGSTAGSAVVQGGYGYTFSDGGVASLFGGPTEVIGGRGGDAIVSGGAAELASGDGDGGDTYVWGGSGYGENGVGGKVYVDGGDSVAASAPGEVHIGTDTARTGLIYVGSVVGEGTTANIEITNGGDVTVQSFFDSQLGIYALGNGTIDMSCVTFSLQGNGSADYVFQIGGNGAGSVAIGDTSTTSLGLSVGASADITLSARGGSVTLNQTGNTALVGFTATSIIGALNELKAGGGGGEDLAATLAIGNTTGGNDIVISNGDAITGETEINLQAGTSGVNGSDVDLLAGSATTGLGGSVILTSGGGGTTGHGGDVQLTTGAGGSTSGNSGAISLQVGSVTSGALGSIYIGTANDAWVYIGDPGNANQQVRVQAGDSVLIDSDNAVNIGTNGADSVTIGSLSATSVTISAIDVSIQSGGAETINIGTASAQTVNIGAAGGSVNIYGSTINASGHFLVEDVLAIFANNAATGDEAGLAFERGSSGDDAIFLWNEASTRFELGLFDTTGGTTVPTGNLATLAPLRLSNISMSGTAITADAALTITATGTNVLNLVGERVQANALPIPAVLSITSVDLATVATTNLYTVPTGRSLVVTDVFLKPTTATAAVGDAQAGVGVAAGEVDIANQQTLTGLDATTEAFRLTLQNPAYVAAATEVVKFGVDVADTGTALVADVYLVGYLI